MKHVFSGVGWLFLGLLAACDKDEYVVEMTPKGDAFERKLTCSIHGDARPTEEKPVVTVSPEAQAKLIRLEGIYGPGKWAVEGPRRIFTGIFEQRTPADIGGWGAYTHHASPLGSTFVYRERFRGNDDLAGQLEKSVAAANDLVDMLIGWVQQEMGDDADFSKMREIMDNEVRSDVANLFVYLWTGSIVEHAGESARDEEAYRPKVEVAARIWQYFLERDYLRLEDIPRLTRRMEAGDAIPSPVMIQRAVARKIGVPDTDPVPASLDFLAKPEAMEASLRRYLSTTEIFEGALAEWQAEADKPPEDTPPDPVDVWVEHFLENSVFEFSQDKRDQVEVRLACATGAYDTNGLWNAETGIIRWSFRLGSDRALPAFCYAAWSAPQMENQIRSFGRVVLSEENLFEYNLWYEGLEPMEVAAWDAFIEACEPNDELISRIESFRFPGDAVEKPGSLNNNAPSLADMPRALILEGLGEGSGHADAQ